MTLVAARRFAIVTFALLGVVILIIAATSRSSGGNSLAAASVDPALARDLASANHNPFLDSIAAERRANDVAEANAQGTVAEMESLALGGNYQAQRNLAYRLSNGDAAVQKRPLDGCAWRIVILLSGNKSVDQTDVANKELECNDRLNQPELVAAAAKASKLTEQISSR